MTKLMKQMLSLVVVFAMAVTSFGALDAQAEDAVLMSFPDVPAGHWAEKHVAKLALQGVINGRVTNGIANFFPNEAVKKQDVIVMAIGFMGLAEQAQADFGGRDAILPLTVGDYAKEEVLMANQRGLINFNEEANTFEGENWGASAASREWAAKIIVRAIGKQAELESIPMLPSGMFSDTDQISAWAIPYINAAVHYKIMSGSNGKILPQQAVTRAQMAVLFGEAEQYMSTLSDKVIQGTVTAASLSELTLRKEDGTTASLALAPNALVYDKEQGGVKVTVSSIKPYSKAYVISNANTAYFIELLETVELTGQEGKVLQVKPTADGFELTLQIGDAYETVSVGGLVPIFDGNGLGISYSQIVANSTVEIFRSPDIEDNAVQRIVLKQLPVNKTAVGTIAKITADQIDILLDGTSTVESYPIAELAPVTYMNKTYELTKIQQNDHVQVTIVNTVATKIEVLDTVVPVTTTVEGEIRSVIASERLLVMQDNVAYDVALNAKIVIGGADEATIQDLMASDKVKLTVNAADEVIEVQVLNRQIEKTVMKEVLTYLPKQNYLFIDFGDDDSKPAYFLIDSRTTVRNIAGNLVDSKDYATVLAEGTTVDLTYSGERVISVQVSNTYDGTVTSVNASTRMLRMTTNDNHTIDLPLQQYTFVEMSERTSATVNDLKQGDRIRVYLDQNQEYAQRIQVKNTKVYKVSAAPTASSRIKTTDLVGTSYDLYVPTGSPIYNQNRTSILQTALKADDIIFVDYLGTAISEVRVANAMLGKITSVSGSQVTLQPFGSTSTQSFTAMNAAQLSVGRPVNMLTDWFGNSYGHTLNVIEKKVSKVDVINDKLTVYRTLISDQSDYKLADNVALYKNGASQAMSTLLNGDIVDLYILFGQVVVIEKKN